MAPHALPTITVMVADDHAGGAAAFLIKHFRPATLEALVAIGLPGFGPGRHRRATATAFI